MAHPHEVWAFCYAKQKNCPAEKQRHFGYGDVWTWTAIDAETKLIHSFTVGNRDAASARILIEDSAGRLRNRIQLTLMDTAHILRQLRGRSAAT